MHDVEPVGVCNHGQCFEDKDDPFVVGYGAAVVFLATRMDRFTGLNGSEDAAKKNQCRGTVEGYTDGPDVGG